MNDELWEQAHKAADAARGAQKQLGDAWSKYRSLVEAADAPAQYHALIPKMEAQTHVLQQARVDVEKAETERRAAYDAAIRQPVEEPMVRYLRNSPRASLQRAAY